MVKVVIIFILLVLACLVMYELDKAINGDMYG